MSYLDFDWNTPSFDANPPIWVKLPKNPIQEPKASIEIIISMIAHVCELQAAATVF
jgi:hypothetical protein